MLTNLRRWLAPPVFEGDEEKSRAAALLNIILWTFMVASLVYAIFAPIEAETGLRRAGIVFTFIGETLFFIQMVNRGLGVRSRGKGSMFCFTLPIKE